jgi:hypothetical protein
MRPTAFLPRALLLTVAAAAASVALAQDDDPFIPFDAVGLFRKNLTAKASGAIAASQRIAFNTGFRLNAEFGYRINDWMHGRSTPACSLG